MSRARGRGRHGPPAGRDQAYLYYATGESQRAGHEEQFDAAEDVEGTEAREQTRVEVPGGAVSWERRTPAARKAPRTPEYLVPQYGHGDDLGIPGGLNHNDANTPVAHEKPPETPELDPFRGMMAHGVRPDDVGVYQREVQGRKPYKPEYAPVDPGIRPVPVYVVEGSGGPKPKAKASYKTFTAPAASAQPIEIAGQDTGRSLVQLLNEDSTHNCRIGELADLTYDAQNSKITGGSRLPAAATGYTVLRTQTPLYVISEDSSTPHLSVIIEYEVAEAG